MRCPVMLGSHETVKLAGVASSLILAICAGRVEADPIPILNHSFESPDAGGAWLNVVPDDWQPGGPLIGAPASAQFVEDNASVGFTGGDGIQHAGLEWPGGYIYQDLGVPFQADMTYRIDLAGAHRSGFTHGIIEFGLFSSTAIGTDLGTPGFIDLQGFFSGSGNPDADDVFDVLRDASELRTIGSGALGQPYRFDAGDTPPPGNIVAFIRHAEGSGGRVTFDNIRLDESPSLLPGDVNNDGVVDLDDFAIIRDNFRMTVASRSLGDLNEDGRVDFLDYLEWRAHATPAAAASASFASPVPEPTGLALGAAAVIGVGLTCRVSRCRPRRKRV